MLTGSCASLPRRVLITVSVATIRRISRKICVLSVYDLQNFDRNFANLVASPTDATEKCFMHFKVNIVPQQMSKTKSKSMHNWRRYPYSNCYKIDKNAVLNLALYCDAIWRRREKPQSRCTTTVPPVYNCPKIISENFLREWISVRTNLFSLSHFWTPDARFDNCCRRYIAKFGKKL